VGRLQWKKFRGLILDGATLEEARENLKDALPMVLEANRELSEKEQEATRREDLGFSQQSCHQGPFGGPDQIGVKISFKDVGVTALS
jgi:methylglyoxal synthase